jgi:hypothetical protein
MLMVNALHAIGKSFSNNLEYWNPLNGYLAQVHFIDGQALDPTSFGQFDSNGVWQAAKYTGTYGTNGFYLDFSNNSSVAALGQDSSGNGNDFTPVNFAIGPIYGGLTTATGTGGVSGINSSQPISNLYDGNTETYVATNVSIINVTPAILTLTFNPGIPFTSTVRARAYEGPDETVTYNFNGEGENAWSPSGVDWQTVKSGSGLMTSLEITRLKAKSTGGAVELYGLEVDGVLLVDSGLPQDTDSLVDSPINGNQEDTGIGGEVSGNYCVWDAVFPAFNQTTLSNGNLDSELKLNSGNTPYIVGTFALSSGKWFFEVTLEQASSDTEYFGLIKGSKAGGTWSFSDMIAYFSDGRKSYTSGPQGYGDSYSTNDVIGVAFDADAGQVTFYKNGVSQGVAFNNIDFESFKPFISTNGSSTSQLASTNFGQRPFAYPISGYKCLNTASLPEPTIPDGSKYFDTKLWTGNGSTQVIDGYAYSPDLIWIKSRSSSWYNELYDTVRGVDKVIYSNETLAENSSGTRGLGSFNNNGFDVTTANSQAGTNTLDDTYVGWAWDAGTETVTNNDGTIESQVRAQPSAGCSIVGWTGTGASNAIVGHGLNAAPEFIIVKQRIPGPGTDLYNWNCYHSALGPTKFMALNTTGAQSTGTMFNNTQPTGSVFSLGSGGFIDVNNASGVSYIAYCFAPVEGYSSVGSYVGNGSADGPFVHLGFKPKWIMIKRTDAANNWAIFDTARSLDNDLKANTAEPEGNAPMAFYSNGFAPKNSLTSTNASGGTYIYAAFAEHSFSNNGGIAR